MVITGVAKAMDYKEPYFVIKETENCHEINSLMQILENKRGILAS